MVVDELDALRTANEGCQTVAFGDLSTQMILITDTQTNLPREALDRLCAQAALVLGRTGKTALGTVPGLRALLADTTSLRLFLRATDEPDDVLCCVCAPDVDVDKFIADATECLHRISNSNN